MGSVGTASTASGALEFKRNSDGTIQRNRMNMPNIIRANVNKLPKGSMSIGEVKGLFSGNVYAAFPAAERYLEELPKSTDKRRAARTVEIEFNSYIREIREVANDLRDYEGEQTMSTWLLSQADSYSKRFNKVFADWKKRNNK